MESDINYLSDLDKPMLDIEFNIKENSPLEFYK
jgi:hypothetical protein